MPPSSNASRSGYRHFAEWFKPAHEVHQQFHVAFGPCTAACSNPPACRSRNCEFLLPLHAGYDLLLQIWGRRFGVGAPCDAVDASTDFDADECMPFLLPLTSVRRAVCSGTQRYSYQGGENLM